MTFAINSASYNQVYHHLFNCNENFIPALTERGNLEDYASKISNVAIKFEAWHHQNVIGLIAAYFNNIEKGIGFITNVSVETDFLGKGIAKQLLQNCIDYGKKHNFNFINLQVFQNNLAAIKLYQKFGFTEVEKKDEFLTMQLSLQ